MCRHYQTFRRSSRATVARSKALIAALSSAFFLDLDIQSADFLI
jgi:hypothetical protein